VEVSRASQVQNAPQIGFAHNIPITKVTVVNTTPTSAAARAKPRALLVADMPYGACDTVESAVNNAKLLVAAGAEAVKAEGGRPILAQIRATLNPAAASAYAPKRISKAEELAKNIAQVLKRSRIKTYAPTSRITDSRVTIAVVERSLLRVGQDRIGLGDFLKPLLRIRIVWVAIRMVLHGELPVSALQFLIADRAGHRQHFVIIAFCVCGQNKLPFLREKLWEKLKPVGITCRNFWLLSPLQAAAGDP